MLRIRPLKGVGALLLLLALSAAAFARADDAEVVLDEETLALISNMRVKQMKEELAERGLECVACAEKSDVADMLKANWHLPKGNRKPEPAKKSAAKREMPDYVNHGDKPELDELLKELKKKGFASFTKEEMEERMKQKEEL